MGLAPVWACDTLPTPGMRVCHCCCSCCVCVRLACPPWGAVVTSPCHGRAAAAARAAAVAVSAGPPVARSPGQDSQRQPQQPACSAVERAARSRADVAGRPDQQPRRRHWPVGVGVGVRGPRPTLRACFGCRAKRLPRTAARPKMKGRGGNQALPKRLPRLQDLVPRALLASGSRPCRPLLTAVLYCRALSSMGSLSALPAEIGQLSALSTL